MKFLLIFFIPFLGFCNCDSFLYFSSGDNVHVLDTKTASIVATLPVTDAQEIHLTPDGKIAYMIGANNVYVLDTATNDIVTMIPLSGNGGDVAFSPNGQFAYVSVRNSTFDHISVINVKTHTIVQTIAVPGLLDPNEPVVTPNTGRFLYITDDAVLKIGVVDLFMGSFVRTIDNLTSPIGEISITPDGRYLYVGGLAESVDIVDTETDAVTVLPLGHFGLTLDITLDGKYVYVASYFDTSNAKISVIDTATQSVVESFSVAASVSDVCLTPNAKFLCTGLDTTMGDIQLIDTQTHNVLATVPSVGRFPHDFAITPLKILASYKKRKEHFLTETDLINVIKWSICDEDVDFPVQYEILRDSKVIAGIPPKSADSPCYFEDHNRKKDKKYSYSIIARGVVGNIPAITNFAIQ